jgi:hypothetical protein
VTPEQIAAVRAQLRHAIDTGYAAYLAALALNTIDHLAAQLAARAPATTPTPSTLSADADYA